MKEEIQNLDPEDAQMDATMRAHVKRALEVHVGASTKRFAEHLEHERKEPRFTSLWIGAPWSLGLVGAALAATVMIVAMRHTVPAVRPIPNIPPAEPVALTGHADFTFHTVDRGIVQLPDGSLARKYLQHRTDTITVVDPKTHEQIVYEQPRDQTILVGLKQY